MIRSRLGGHYFPKPMVYLAPTYLIPFQVFGPTLWVSQQCDGARGQFAAERVRGSRQVQHLSTRANSDVAAPVSYTHLTLPTTGDV